MWVEHITLVSYFYNERVFKEARIKICNFFFKNLREMLNQRYNNSTDTGGLASGLESSAKLPHFLFGLPNTFADKKKY